MGFVLRLICDLLVLVIIYVTGSYVYHYVDLNYFTRMNADSAWWAVLAVTVAYCLVASTILFSIVEALFPK